MKALKTPGGKSYRFEQHALDRMAQRRIKRKEIEGVLDNHDICHTDVRGNPCYIGSLADGRRLRVVVEKSSNPLVIITAVILS